MVSLNTLKGNSQRGLPAFRKITKMLIIKTKGITARDLFKISIMGMFDKRIRMKISMPYKLKAKADAGLVKITIIIKTKKVNILILGSMVWIKLFIWLYSSIYECSIFF
jgi:hypothetical protein